MAIKDVLISAFEKAYKGAKAKEAEELHNAIVEVINKHQPSIENALYVLDIIRFGLMEAKYKEILGVVKLTEKAPIKKIGE